MSTTIDSRVVEMSFDNKNFESNVQTSLGTLDKLKHSLDVSGMAKGFEDIESSVKNTNFGILGDAVETVSGKFSALEQLAIGALRRIGEQIVNTGEQMVRSVTIEPIKQGFDEYETKMGAVQTIMASSGADLDTVMGKLGELNTYADKTIYSFSDMTQNIGKFTNAGVDLDMAVAAIQGISNEAALSGANANEASRAMYNFAQALSSGYVKLIDWKSIENANMATVEFKTQLLEMAVACGKAEKTADGMYRVLGTNNQGKTMDDVIDATHNFNESLQYQWMTSEVLTQTLAQYSDEQTDIGKRAYAAAQDIKTFTQMMDTLKEAAGSGWSETFELIFGNFEEAKKLWTGLGNTIGGWIQESADARNKFLEDWKNGYTEIDEYGNLITISGRESMINAFSNIYEAISKIVTPIKEAFREIFAPLSGTEFAKMSHNFELFTEKLIISDETAGKIKEVFKAVFEVIRDVGEAIGTVIGAIIDIGKGLAPILEPVGSLLKDLGGKIYDFITSFSGNEDKLGTFKTNVEKVVEFITGIPEKINTAFTNLTGMSVGDAFDKLVEAVSGAYEKVKEFFGNFGTIDTSGLESFKNASEEKLKPVSTFFEGLKNLFSGVVDFFSGLAPILSAAISVIGDALSTIGGWFKDKFGGMDSEDFKNILAGGGIAAVALTIKDILDSFKDVGENSAKMIEGITGVLNSVKDTFKAFQNDLKADMLLKIAAAIGVLTAAVMVLTTVEPERLVPAAAAVGSMVAVLVTAMAVLGSSKIDTAKIDKATNDILKMSLTIVATGIAVKKVADAIVELMGPIQQFSQMKWGEIGKGLAGVGAVLAELFVFFKFLDSSKISLSTSIAIAIISASLAALSEVVKMYGNLPIETFVQGLIGMGLGLGEVVLFLNLVPNNAVEKSVAIGLISAALLVLCGSLAAFGVLPLKVLTQGMIAVAIALGEMVLFLNLMEGTIAGSAALAIAAASIALLVPSITALGLLPIKTLAVGLGAFTAALLALTGIGYLATGATVGLLALGAAVGLIGAGAALAGAGLVSIAAGLTALSVAAAAGVGAITLIVTGLINLVPTIAKAIGEGIITIMSTIASNVETLIELAKGIGLSIIAALRDLIPAVIDLVVEMARKLADAAPEFDQSITDMILALLKTVENNIGPITETMVNAFINWLDVLGEKIPQINQALFDFVMNLIEGFGQSVEDNAERLREVMISLGKHMLNAIKNFFGIHSPSTVMADIGKQLILGLINGIGSLIVSLLSKIGELMTKAITAIKDKFSEWLQAGRDLIEKVKSGVAEKIEIFKSKVTELMTNGKQMILDKFEEWKEAGHELIEKVKTGVADKIEAFKTKVTELVNKGKQMITDKFTEWLNAGKDLIEKVKTGVNDKISAFKSKVTELVNNGKQMIVNKFTEWQNAGKDLIEKVKTGVHDKMEVFKSKVTELVNNGKKMITNKFEEWKTAGKDIIEKVRTGINDKMEVFKSKVTELVNKGKQMITDKFEEWKTAGQNLWLKVKTGVSDKAEEFKNKVTSIVNEGKQKISDKFEEWKTAGMDLLGKVKAGLEDPATASKWYTAVSTVVSAGKGKIEEKFTEWWTAGSTLISNVKSGAESIKTTLETGISTLISNAKESAIGQKLQEWIDAGSSLIDKIAEGIGLKSIFSDIWNVVSNGLSGANGADMIQNWINAGWDLIQGLIDGVAAQIQNFGNKVVEVVTFGLFKGKEAARSHSPSKAMRDLGNYMGEGLVLGIDDYKKDVGDSSGNLGKTAVNSMEYALSKLNDAIEFGIDDSPTIRPVLDLTDFNDGMNVINDSFAKAANMGLSNTYRNFADVMSNEGAFNVNANPSNSAPQYIFNQNNYSPKALSRIDIYRHTKNQFLAMERAVSQA